MNRLSHETSPYLLQHAHNPVDWFPWGDEALTKARQEDRPILVSIGYSACHWCHVMERESFENEPIARVMNENFVCIKVDREERPDVDTVYMEAVQAMGVRGGWPLNVFLMPDARPFYGLTYLPPQQWVNLLGSVQSAFSNNRQQLQDSADGFASELNVSDSVRFGLTLSDAPFSPDVADDLFGKLATKFDRDKGGMNRAPKFPMPSIYSFLLNFSVSGEPLPIINEPASAPAQARQQTNLTLTRMALGGIYDQIGGGFSRYSVDEDWFAPHFEKMLYDNGQLLTVYADAYRQNHNSLYKHVVYQTIAWATRELQSPEGGFYSALDADSEGVEGKFYTWTTPELQEILGTDFDWFAELYSIPAPVLGGSPLREGEEGGVTANWEHGRNILHRTLTDEAFAERADWTVAELREMLDAAHAKLMAVRDTRIRPGLDDKILCSWNGLMLTGLVSAYRAFDEPGFLETALRLAHFLLLKMRDSRNRRLWHSYKNGRAKQIAFLDDYAAVIAGLLALYQVTFTESWLREADQLAHHVLAHFDDPTGDRIHGEHNHGEPLLFFTDASGEELIARRKELFDNVMPASNSIMAANFFTLSLLLDRPAYAERADRMMGVVDGLLRQNPDYLTNWAALYVRRTRPAIEIAIVGPQALAFRQQLDRVFNPQVVFCGTESVSPKTDLPLLQNRGMIGGKTAIYVCQDRMCQLPVTSVDVALALLPSAKANGNG